MSGRNKRTSLTQAIAHALRGRTYTGDTASRATVRKLRPEQLLNFAADNRELPSRCMLMTGVALAILQTQPAHALSLGDLQVQSALGEPFVGTTSARLGPGETLTNACITTPRGTDSSLSAPADLRVSVPNATTPGSYPVQIRSATPLYEPMYEIRLQIDCPGGVALSKSYVVMLNLPMAATTQTLQPVSPVASVPQATQQRATAAKRSTPNTRDTRKLSSTRAAIAAGERYRVRNGDTLSVIAERIDGRPVGSTWAVTEMLFASNPHAFVRGDRNLLKLGAVLNIPDVATLAGATRDDSAEERPATARTENAPQATGNPLVNVELGRPEESVTATPEKTTSELSNAELLEQIRREAIASNSREVVGDDARAAAPPPRTVADSETVEVSPFADEQTEVTPTADTPSTASTFQPPASPAVVDDRAGMEQAAASTSTSPILAAVAGIAVGFILALLILGRSLVAPLLANRAQRKAAHAVPPQPAAEPLADAFAESEAGEPIIAAAPVSPHTESAQTDEATFANTPASAYGTGGIDVEFGEADAAPHPVDADISTPQTLNTPRVSLRGHTPDNALPEDLVSTDRFKSPQFKDDAVDLQDSDPHSDTMRSLFADTASGLPAGDSDTLDITAELARDAEDDTAEMPAIQDKPVDDISASDLASISRRLQDGGDDDLSATLTQALGLLEQDYEEEMTASQILEKEEIDAAFAQHKKG